MISLTTKLPSSVIESIDKSCHSWLSVPKLIQHKKEEVIIFNWKIDVFIKIKFTKRKNQIEIKNDGKIFFDNTDLDIITNINIIMSFKLSICVFKGYTNYENEKLPQTAFSEYFCFITLIKLMCYSEEYFSITNTKHEPKLIINHKCKKWCSHLQQISKIILI